MTFDSHNTKRVSYVLTTKNHAEYLDTYLGTVHELIKPNDELIIIDGVSTDHTAEVIKKYKDLITVFVSEPDVSISHAFNKGVMLARGKYVKQLYDDDVIYPEAMEKAIAIFEKNPAVEVLVCGGTKSDNGKETVVYVTSEIEYGKKPEDPFLYRGCGTGFVIRRSVFAKAGLFPTGWAGDKVFIAQCISKGAVVKFCRINLFYHPVLGHSIIKSKRQAHQLDTQNAIKQYCSTKFYLQYRIKNVLGLFGLRKTLGRISYLIRVAKVKGVNAAVGLVSRKFLGKKTSDPLPSTKYIWDGGLS